MIVAMPPVVVGDDRGVAVRHRSTAVSYTSTAPGNLPGRRASQQFLNALAKLQQMRILILGAGPAGLLFALLIKRRFPRWQVDVVEQNPAEVTFGFGVVFSQGALEFLERDAPDLYRQLLPRMETWPIQRIVHRDERVDIDGNGFSAIARLELNRFLQALCRDAGVAGYVRPAGRVARGAGRGGSDRRRGRAELGGQALAREPVPAAHRVAHQQVRLVRHPAAVRLPDAHVPHQRARRLRRAPLPLQPDHEHLPRRMRRGDLASGGPGPRCRTPNRAPTASECSPPTWTASPWCRTSRIWRNFPLLTNRRWTVGNAVLIGDALRTGHFSIGSGTRLAFEDAIALDRAFGEAGEDVPRALAAFERERRPVVEKLVAAANASSFWYERMADKMHYEPWQLAYDYMTRSGRVTR